MIYYVLFCYFAIAGFFDFMSGPVKKYFFIVSYIILVLFAGLRFDTGWDYATYRFYFEKIPEISIWLTEGWSYGTSYAYFEYGFQFLIAIVKELGMGFQGFIFICNFIIVLCVMSFIKKYSNYRNTSVLLFYSMLYLWLNFSFIRQGMAVAILCFSFRYILAEKPIKYFYTVLLASLFHVTALVMLLIYPLYKIKINVRIIIILLIFSNLIYFLNIGWFSTIYPYLVSGELLTKLETYMSSERYGSSRAISFGYLEKTFISLMLIVFLLKKRAVSAFRDDIKSVKLFILLFLGLYLLYMLCFEVSIVYDRLKYYFMIPLVILLPIFIGMFKPKAAAVAYLFVLGYAAVYLSNILTYEANRIVFIPYHSVLDDKDSTSFSDQGYGRIKRAELIDHVESK